MDQWITGIDVSPEGAAVAAERWSMARTARAQATRTFDEFVQDLWDENLAMVQEIADLRAHVAEQQGRITDLSTALCACVSERDTAKAAAVRS